MGAADEAKVLGRGTGYDVVRVYVCVYVCVCVCSIPQSKHFNIQGITNATVFATITATCFHTLQKPRSPSLTLAIFQTPANASVIFRSRRLLYALKINIISTPSDRHAREYTHTHTHTPKHKLGRA